MVKKTASFTIDSKTLKEFNDYCGERSINKSNKVEKLIQEFLKQK